MQGKNKNTEKTRIKKGKEFEWNQKKSSALTAEKSIHP